MKETLLENGGGLYKAKDFFDKNPFCLYNVDIVSDLDLSALYRLHIEKKGLATLAVRHRPGKRFLLVDNEGQIAWMEEYIYRRADSRRSELLRDFLKLPFRACI